MKNILLIGFLALVLGCASQSKKEAQNPAEIEAKILLDRTRQGEELNQAQMLLLAGKHDEAIKAFTDFQTKNPNSAFFQSANLGVAQSFEFKGQWTEAIGVYKKVVESTQSTQPVLASYALYRLSFCYEALGQDDKAIATLIDARNRGSKLDPKITLAAIPARLSAAYNRVQRPTESVLELRSAQKGIEQLIKQYQGQSDQAWLGETYLEMGRLSTNQLSFDNLESVTNTLRTTQAFMVKAMELNILPYSKMANEALQENYRDLWNLTMQIPLEASLDEAAAAHAQSRKQVQVVVEIFKLLVELQQHRPMEDLAKNNHLDSFFNYVDELEKRGQLLVANKSTANKITVESIINQNLKKEGMAFSDSLLPEEQEFLEKQKAEKQIPKSQLKKADPNL